MAVFDPAPPYNPGQEYTNIVRPVNEPMVDISGLTKGKAIGKGLSELGQTIEGGLKVAGQATEAKISEEERHGFDQQRGLDQINQDAVTRLTGVAQQLDVLTGDVQAGQNTPDELKNLPKQLDRLDTAMSGKKFIKRYIDGQKWELAKNLRTRYPGWREFIDSSFARSTREDPANQYIGQIEADINNLQTQLGEKKGKIDTLFMKGVEEQMPGFDSTNYALWKAGKKSDGQVIDDYVKGQGDKHNLMLFDQKIKEAEGNEKMQKMYGGQYVSARIPSFTTQVSDKLMTTMKLTNEQLANKVLTNSIKISEQEANILTGQVVAASQEAMANFNRELDGDSGNKNHDSWRQLLGPEDVNKYRDQIQAYWNHKIDAYTHKDYGIAGNMDRTLKAVERTAEGSFALNSNIKIATAYNLSKAASKYPEFAKKITDWAIGQGLSKDIRDYFKFTTDEQMYQMFPEARDLIAHGNKELTMGGDIDLAYDRGVRGKELNDYASRKFDLVDKIADQNTPDDVKLGLAKYAFDPKANNNIFDDPKHPIYDEDKPNVYKRLYSDAMTKEIRRLDLHSPGHDIWKNYTTLAYQQFGSALFHPQIMELNQRPGDPNVSITWDNVNHKFNTAYWGKVQAGGDAALTEYSLWKINQGLGAISNIAKIEHGDVNAYVYKLLTSAGLSPDSEAAKVLMAVHATGKFPEEKSEE